jgi:hypothetical protein
MHDGAPPHFSHAMRDVSNTCHDRRTGTGGPTAWPPRSTPDLNPLEFCQWGHRKTPVYVAPVDKEEALHDCTVDACQTIRNYAGIFKRMWRSMMRRVESCIEFHGGHFEHLFQTYSIRCNSQSKYF